MHYTRTNIYGIIPYFYSVFGNGVIFKYLNDVLLFQIVWLESPTNPLMRVSNLKAISTVAHNIRKDILVVVDNTFQTPYFQVNIIIYFTFHSSG